MKIWGKDCDTHVCKDMQMANKYLKRCSLQLVIRKTQFQDTATSFTLTTSVSVQPARSHTRADTSTRTHAHRHARARTRAPGGGSSGAARVPAPHAARIGARRPRVRMATPRQRTRPGHAEPGRDNARARTHRAAVPVASAGTPRGRRARPSCGAASPDAVRARPALRPRRSGAGSVRCRFHQVLGPSGAGSV